MRNLYLRKALTGTILPLSPACRRQRFHIIKSYLQCKLAEETEIPELKTMARTIRDKLDGIVTYWTFRHISNAKMEGFNNKIRWLIKLAYGFRDHEYFKLKIYQLPEISSEKSI